MITLTRAPSGETEAARAAEPPVPPAPARAGIRQLVVGLLALPLTALPFVAYANLTPEGRLVRDRAIVALAPPSLPKLSAQERDAAVAAAPRYEGAVMAVAYHGIGSASDSEGGFVVSPKRFAEHLATLKAAGMNAVTAAQVAAAFTGGEPLPANAVMISFDDGRADAMMFADPLLKGAGMSATMFVIADAASKPGVYYASWDRIEGYARSGRWDIESHTAGSHREQKATGGESLPVLTSLAPGESLDEYRTRIHGDLARSSTAIKEHTGRAPVAFAYPFGAYGADRSNDPAIADVLRAEVAHRFAVAFQQDDQDTVPLLTTDQDHLRLRRVEVQNWSGEELLHRIERARTEPVDSGEAPATPADGGPRQPVVTVGEPPTTQPGSSTTTSSVPGSARTTGRETPAAALPTVTLPQVTVPGAVSVPPVAVTVPGVTLPTVPLPTVPVVTVPPGTTPTTKPPPTTVPPTTTPPTTVCTPIGKSGKCR